jgi:hypothetical protein
MNTSGSRPQETTFSQSNSLRRRPRRHSNHSPLNQHNKHVHNFQNLQTCTIDYFLPQNSLRNSNKNNRERFYSYSDDQHTNKRPSHTFDFENTCNYRENVKKAALDKKTRLSSASTASESDSSSSHGSELSGFKIVHRGKVVHNEAEEEADLNDNNCTISCKNEEKRDSNGRFASSLLVVGPNVGEISIPSFA